MHAARGVRRRAGVGRSQEAERRRGPELGPQVSDVVVRVLFRNQLLPHAPVVDGGIGVPVELDLHVPEVVCMARLVVDVFVVHHRGDVEEGQLQVTHGGQRRQVDRVGHERRQLPEPGGVGSGVGQIEMRAPVR